MYFYIFFTHTYFYICFQTHAPNTQFFINFFSKFDNEIYIIRTDIIETLYTFQFIQRKSIETEFCIDFVTVPFCFALVVGPSVISLSQQQKINIQSHSHLVLSHPKERIKKKKLKTWTKFNFGYSQAVWFLFLNGQATLSGVQKASIEPMPT